MGRAGWARARSTAAPSSSTPTGSSSGPVTVTWYATAVTASCSAGARSASATVPVTSIPSGNASDTRCASESSGTSSTSCTSRYSASLSCPTDRASPKLTLGRGAKPCVNASGSCSMRKARSNARATSRWEMKRTLPRFVKRTRTGNPSSPRTGARLLPDAEEVDRRVAAAAEVLARPLAPARRRHRRGDDVLERVIGAYAAVVTGCPAAVGKAVLVQRGLPVLPEEIAMQPGRDVIPRQDLVCGAMPRHVPVGVETLGCHRVEPAAELEALAPLLERPALPPDAFDDATDAPVTPAGDPFGERRRRVVPAELHAGLADCAAQQPDLALQLVDAVLAE